MKITSNQAIYPEKGIARHVLGDWHPHVDGGGSSILELKVYRLGTTGAQIHIPKRKEQRFWYGIHFVSQPAGYAPGLDTVKLFPFISLLDSNFRVCNTADKK